MPIIGITASSNQTIKLTNFVSIATTTVGAGGAANVTFNSIPTSYTNLQIRGIARSSSATVGDYLYLQFNSDTGTNYTFHQLSGDGATASASNGLTQSGAASPRISAGSDGANVFGAFVINILDYKNTNKNKTVQTLGGYDSNGSGVSRITSGLWLNTAAINSIAIKSGNGSNLAQYSSIALYGVI